ncbi:MAG: molybdopterin-binding protein, partial [Chloroflexota bacterium]|nr:molybdopterin-binding protein [Chloroflexota bacterium]
MFTVAILTISDKGSIGQREDESGKIIREMVTGIGARVAQYAIVPDDKESISGTLIEWANGLGV